MLVVQNDDTDPVGPLGDWLTEGGVELDVVTGPQLPSSLENHSGMVVLGGAMGAQDDAVAPWLPHERQLLRDAVRDEVPTLAICLGAQLLALANGGRVETDPEGPEVGAQLVAKRAAAAGDPLFGELPITPDVLQWHYDFITALPPGAVHLAASPRGEHQAFRLGRLAWGVQFHIETTPELVRSWAAGDAPRLLELDYDLDLLLSRAVDVHPDLEEVWAPFARSFAEIVRAPQTVAPARNVPTSTAAPVTDPAAIRAALAAEADASRTHLPIPGYGLPNSPDE